MVAIAGIIVATIIGFIVGIGRLSHNWLIRKICTVYVEIFRNIPPLLVIFFWYYGVLAVLPLLRESIDLPFASFLNVRGFYFPAMFGTATVSMVLVGLHRHRPELVRCPPGARQMATGQHFPVFWVSLALIVGLPLLAYSLSGFPVTFDFPQKATST